MTLSLERIKAVELVSIPVAIPTDLQAWSLTADVLKVDLSKNRILDLMVEGSEDFGVVQAEVDSVIQFWIVGAAKAIDADAAATSIRLRLVVEPP